MKRNKQTLAQAWKKRSQDDLAVAKLVMASQGSHEIALFHLQQSIEKAIKAYLIWHEQDFPHVHDIERLLYEASQIDQKFADWERLEDMSIFAVAGRYPESDSWIGECSPSDWLVDVEAFCTFVWAQMEGL
jgi:HEPN domain-containing protein